MMSGKILILDDKVISENQSLSQAILLLSDAQKNLVEYYKTSDSLWTLIDNGDDLKLLKDFSSYKIVFIHYSLNDPIIGEEIMGKLIDDLSRSSTVVLFSGNRLESEIPIMKRFDEKYSEYSYFEIRRSQVFNNLGNLINGYLLTGEFQIKYLYNHYLDPKKDCAYALLENIKTDLEESIQRAIKSDSFYKLLNLYDYKNTLEISARLLKMTDDSFIETLEDLIENNK